MKQKFKPVILLGVGKYGAEITQGVYTILSERQKDLTKVISCLILGENGEYRDIKENVSFFKCNRLKSELSLENFSANFRVIQDQEKKFEDFLADRIENIRRKEVLIELQDKGYEIGKDINLFLISTLFDSIGSAAIIPFLGFIQCLSAGTLRGSVINTELFTFFPDLFAEYKRNDLAYSRSYSCLQELDFIADRPNLISSEGLSPFSFAWIFTGKNEENVQIGSYKNLIPMIGEILFSLLTGEIASDISFSTIFLNKVDGKATRYSSFGLAKLIFPVNDVMRGLSNYLGFNILELKGVAIPKVFERKYIGADVQEFLFENKFDKLFDELELDTEGKRIWVDFKYKGTINESVVVQNFVDDIKEEAEDFHKDEVTAMDRKLSLRREQLFEEKTGKLLDVIKNGIDSERKGIYYGKAFLNTLQNQKSLYTKGDIVEKIYTLDLVEKEIKSFFDRIFRVEREKLGKLKKDIDDKILVLKKFKKELQKKKPKENLKERVKALETEIEDLKKKYSKFSNEIADFNLRITDASGRQKLLAGLENEIKKEVEKVRSDLQETDKKYREERQKLDELYEKRKRIVRELLIVFPCVGTIAFFIIFYLISRIPGISLLYMLKIGGKVYPFGLLGYGIWGFSKYWRGIKKEIEEVTARVISLKNEKVAFLLKYQELHNRIFKTRFNHSLYGGLFEWIRDYKDFVAKIGNKLQYFIDALVQGFEEKKEAWKNISFRNTLFVRSVVTKKDLERFIEKNVRLPLEMERFFKEKPLSSYFDEFRKTRTLNTLSTALDDFSEEVFESVREKSIEEFLEEEEREGRVNTAEKLSNLYNSAKAFILLDVEKGMDVSQPLIYLGVENPETSYAKEILREQGYTNIQPCSVKNKNEIIISKLKIGFPAFHIALIKHGEKLISKTKNRKGLYINPEWESEGLFPSVYALENEEGEPRRIACLGRVFGLIEEKKGKFYLENKKFSSDQEIIEFLRSFKGSNLRNKLSRQIEEEKQKKNAIERLIAYEESKKLDEIDKKIIERVINELNPLA